MKKKKLIIVEEFSNVSYKRLERNIFYQNYNNNASIHVRMWCPVDKKIYNNSWPLQTYSYNEALIYAKKDLDYIKTRREMKLPLKYYTIKYWINKDKNEYILL
jgi:hypothetical protein